MNNISVLCHRGLIRSHENTYNNICAVSNYKEDKQNIKIGVEFDIQLLKDNTIVIYHDETLERLHYNNNILSDLEYKDIVENGYNIALLDDVLIELVKNENIVIDIEVKIYTMSNDRILFFCKLLLEKINKFRNKIIISSFSEIVINNILELNNIIKINYEICYLTYDEIDIIKIDKMINNGLTCIGFYKNNYHIFDKYIGLGTSTHTININYLIYTLFDKESNIEYDKYLLDLIRITCLKYKYTNSSQNIYIVTDRLNNTIDELN